MRPLPRSLVVRALLVLVVACVLGLSGSSIARADAPRCGTRSVAITPLNRERIREIGAWLATEAVKADTGAIQSNYYGTALIEIWFGNQAALGLLDAGGLGIDLNVDYCEIVGRWIDWQLEHLQPDGRLINHRVEYHDGAYKEVADPEAGSPALDNKSASLLSVARLYLRRTGGRDWFLAEPPGFAGTGQRRIDLLAKAAGFLDDNLLETIAPLRPLCGATAYLARVATGPGGVHYLADNLAVWAGYRDYGDLLARVDPGATSPNECGATESSATRYQRFAARVRAGIEQALWNQPNGVGTYLPYEGVRRSFDWRVFYGDAVGAVNTFSCGGYDAFFTPLPEGLQRSSQLWSEFIHPHHQAGWIVQDVPDTDFPWVQNAVSAEYAGDPATALVWESNLRELIDTTSRRFYDPAGGPGEWRVNEAGWYIRYLTRIHDNVLVDAPGGPAPPEGGSVTSTGAWTFRPVAAVDDTSASTAIMHAGNGYWFDDKSKQSTMRFVPNLPADGTYEVRLVYRALPNRTTRAKVTIEHRSSDGAGAERSLTTVDQRVPMAGVASKLVATYRFRAGRDGWVELSNDGADDGVVIADAILFIRR